MTFARKHGCLLILAGLSWACRSDRPGGDAAPAADAGPAATPAAAPTALPLIHVKAADFKFDMPATVPAGAASLHLMNEGKELHHAVIVRLEDGKTLADLAQAMKTEGPPPPWVKFVGGPNGVAPGGTATATLLLTPGHYAAICVIPGTDLIPHVAKGMVQGFEVTASSAPAAMPAATDTIRLKDYRFGAGRPLTAGRHTIFVQNDGPQVHELVLLKLSPGKTVKDFGVWATAGGMKGPPPAMPMGGVAPLDAGGTNLFTVNLTPGEYGYICFVPDAKDGKLHLEHGMLSQFSVQ
jgi:uncharacterized cupredoxin-like copper-binding protein